MSKLSAGGQGAATANKVGKPTQRCDVCAMQREPEKHAQGVKDFCDKHAIHYRGQLSQLPPSQQSAWNRLCKERVVRWSSTTAIEARALNSFVKKGVAQKHDGSCILIL